MACPVCPAAGWLGGWVGGYFGIKPPAHSGGRLLSAVITANLISVSIIGLKALFGISLCIGGTFSMDNIVRVGSKALLMGIVYSIGVNFILNRYVYSSSVDPDQKSNPSLDQSGNTLGTSGCCCRKDERE